MFRSSWETKWLSWGLGGDFRSKLFFFTTVRIVKCFSMPPHMNSLYPSVWLLTTGAHNLHAAFECHIQCLAETLGSIQTAPDFNFKARLMAALTHRTACPNPSPPVRLNQIPAFEPDLIRTLWTRRILWFGSLVLLLLSCEPSRHFTEFSSTQTDELNWKEFLLMTKMCGKKTLIIQLLLFFG